MNRPEIIRTLKAHEAELKRRGVEHAALFGILARDEGGADSDIDVMIELDPAARDRVRLCRDRRLCAKPVRRQRGCGKPGDP